MRPHYRAIALAFSIAFATSVLAQAPAPARRANESPITRPESGDVFFYNPLAARGQTLGSGALGNTGIGRPNPRGHHQVTPVPEPSQWAMMAAGLVLVGFIARRNARRSKRDDE